MGEMGIYPGWDAGMLLANVNVFSLFVCSAKQLAHMAEKRQNPHLGQQNERPRMMSLTRLRLVKRPNWIRCYQRRSSKHAPSRILVLFIKVNVRGV